jgi:pimeloyl-ACP methyl ester carboxylesterase
LKPPYVLVGHSLGGLHVQWFARHHPGEIAGLLLLDATHPDDPRRLQGQESRIAAALQRVLALPQRLFRANLHAEIECVGATVRQVLEAPAFPPVPMVVLSGGKVPPAWMVKPQAHAVRQEHQRALAALSPQGEHRIAERSGHFPQLTEPGAVLDALASLLARCAPPV